MRFLSFEEIQYGNSPYFSNLHPHLVRGFADLC